MASKANSDARKARLAQALRENLKRRKAQARATASTACANRGETSVSGPTPAAKPR